MLFDRALSGMKMSVPLFLLLSSAAVLANGGSPCPPRRDIYPCTCLNVGNGNRPATVVSCHRLSHTGALSRSVFGALGALEIDQFFLYDSFWEAEDLEDQKLPHDWIMALRVSEYHIVDSKLSPCFACSGLKYYPCENTYTKRFSVDNSTSSGSICADCQSGGGGRYSWTSCLGGLEQFQLTGGALEVLGPAVGRLRALHLARNRIRAVEGAALRNLPRLEVLDLSHNALRNLSRMFGTELPNLTLLNLSWNRIKTIGDSLWKFLPKLKMFYFKNNLLVDLKENQWKNIPSNISVIDLTENPVHCPECGIRWINQTIPAKKTTLRGNCKTPKQYAGHTLRGKATLFARRCDENGKMTKKEAPLRLLSQHASKIGVVR